MSKLRHMWTAELPSPVGTTNECAVCHCYRFRIRKVFAGVVHFQTFYGIPGLRKTRRAPACVQRRLL